MIPLCLLIFVALALGFHGSVNAFGASSNSMGLRTKFHSNNIEMKIFDWKQREEFKDYKIPDDYVLSVTTLSPAPGSRKKFLRVGRGISAGQGKTCGRGMRGQKSRSGEGKGVRAGFEGGQTALYRRLPKFVGSPQKGHTKTEYGLIKLDMINEFGTTGGNLASPSTLFESGVLTKQPFMLYKVVGGEELTVKGLTVHAHAFTESARAAIEGANGKCVLLSPTLHTPLEE